MTLWEINPKEKRTMKKFMLFLAALTFFVGTAFAQNGKFAPYADGSVSVSAANAQSLTAISNPNFRVGGGIESSTKYLLLDANAQFNSGNLAGLQGLVKNTGGYTGRAEGSAYYKFFGKILVGGGAFWSNQVATGTGLVSSVKTSFNYNQVRPFVGLGLDFSHDRLIVDYDLPGIDQIKGAGLANAFTGVHSQDFTIKNEILLGKTGFFKHVRLTQEVGLDSANTNLAGAVSLAGLRTSAITAGAGIKLVL
jgi:hypothetical protein